MAEPILQNIGRLINVDDIYRFEVATTQARNSNNYYDKYLSQNELHCEKTNMYYLSIFSGLFLLLYIFGGSTTQSLQRTAENRQHIYSAGDFDSSGGRDRNIRRLSGPTATAGGGPAWRERSSGPAHGSAGQQGDITKHLSIDVSSGDQSAAGHAKSPNSDSSETVLGFGTSGVQVNSGGAPPGGAWGPGRQSAPATGRQSAPGTGRQRAHGGTAAQPVGGLSREDISVEVDAGPGGAGDSGRPTAPGQRSSQTGPAQSPASAATSGSGGQRPAATKQLGRPASTKQREMSGGAGPGHSISVSAEMDEGPASGGGPPAGSAEWQPGLIPGQSGVDYPVLSGLPRSGFDCRSQEADGFYADTSDDSRCQVKMAITRRNKTHVTLL